MDHFSPIKPHPTSLPSTFIKFRKEERRNITMAGLGVLLECNTQKKNANNQKILNKTLMMKPHTHPSLPSFLEACNLCSKKLSHEKDIYMYRGDGAFCSVECRDRQIFMDEENMSGEN